MRIGVTCFMLQPQMGGIAHYFLYLFRPADAVITNLALCHFGPAQGPSVFARCLRTHMASQAAASDPNLVISFTAKLRDRRLVRENASRLDGVPTMILPHPAAHIDRWGRRDQLLRELERLRSHLESTGTDVDGLARTWTTDVALASGASGR